MPTRRKPKMPDSFTSPEQWREYEAGIMAEAELQKLVHALARSLGWLRYHTKFSFGSDPGFPDCVYLRGGRLLVIELKREGEVPRPNQEEWLAAWRLVPCAEVHVFTPLDYLNGKIAEVLA